MINSNNFYNSLEDALHAMIQDKMQDPSSITLLSPADENLNKQWHNAGYIVCTNPSYSNIPSICLFDDNGETQDLMKDIQKYVAAISSKIKKLYGVGGNDGWELTFLSTKEDNKTEDVNMAIEPQYADNAEAMLKKYNKECSEAGFKTKLSLNRQTMVIEGEFVEKNSGFFNRMKINSQNRRAHKEFRDFLKSLDSFYWKL